MSLSSIFAGVIILGAALLFIILSLALKGRQMFVFRSISAFRILNHMMGKSVEQGRALHITLGTGSLISRQSTIGFCGLATLCNLSRVSLISDNPAVCTSGDGGLVLLSMDTLNQVYRQAMKLSINQRAQARLTGATPSAYVTGTLTALYDESFSGSILIGDFTNLAVLLTGLPFQEHATLAATDSLGIQAAFYACSDETLLGEDVFATGAYTAPNPSRSASLITQDVLRWLIICMTALFIALKLAGVI